MKLYRPPQPVESYQNSLFVAGAITGAPDWQTEFANDLRATDLTLLNPRREIYNALDPDALREQIRWEHDGLRNASAISFWFPADALCMISLYELGSWAHWRDEQGQPKPLFVAAQAEYARYDDVIIQLELERPDVKVLGSLQELTAQITAWQNKR